jgi:hypothetical protein
MEGMNERMGLFPALLTPAKEAAAKLLSENLTRVPVEGKADFMVAPEGTIDESAVYFRFEHEGHRFVIFEQGSID